ncbi:hypothetical protein M405DRAFT_827305 [Rhizopogon salebrosus TDB-379]|nr:hypothetical protein M405DRAFT_827305 [Rhizopogon salebrosus TDB-379]
MWDFSPVCVLMPYWFLRLIIFATRSPVDDRILTHISTNHRDRSYLCTVTLTPATIYFLVRAAFMSYVLMVPCTDDL